MVTPNQDHSHDEPVVATDAWARPDFEVIPLDCEITAYAPDGGDPLF